MSLNAKYNPLESVRGQRISDESVPVVIASDQTPIPVTVPGTIPVSGTVTANQGTANTTSEAWPVVPTAIVDGVKTTLQIDTITPSNSLGLPVMLMTPFTGNFAAIDASGNLSVTGPLTDTQLRASPVSVTGPLTDTQLRASPVPISGTVTANAGTGNFTVVQPTAANLNATIAPLTNSSVVKAQLQDNSGNGLSSTSGALNINLSTSSITLPVSLTYDTNYGTVGSSTLRTAAQIGNASGSAAFGIGASDTQTLRVVLPNNQPAIPVTQSGTWSTRTQDGSGNLLTSTLVSGKQALDINLTNSSLSVAIGVADESGFTYGTTNQQVIGGVYQDTSPTLAAGQQGAARLTQYRAFHTNLRNSTGVEIATSGNPLRIDPTGTTIQPVSGTVSVNQSGTWSTRIQDVNNTTMGPALTLSGVNYFPVYLAAGANVGSAVPSRVIMIGAKDNLGDAQPLIVDSNNALTVAGNKTTNNAAPSSDNIGVLSAVASYKRQPLTNGNLGVLSQTLDGFLRVKPSNLSIVEDSVTSTRHNQIEVDFSKTFDSTIITNSTTNGGTTTQSQGSALYTTGTNANGTASGTTVATISYRAGTEIYAYFTASFTTPTSANSNQRIGIYSSTDGFFIGYKGTTFGLTQRTNSVDTFTPQSSFNRDTLNGSSTSIFTRNGTPEAIDPTKLNLYRIRFAWFGSGPIRLDVMSPDGHWVLCNHVSSPNTSNITILTSPSQPMTVEALKSSADATSLTVKTSCWAGGCTEDGFKLTENITDNTLAPVVRSVLTGRTTAGGSSYVNVKVNPSGALNIALGDITGVVGQQTMAASLPVAIASNQSAFPVNTKTDLTPSSPTFATVGITSAQALASNANRKGLILVNTSANTISIGIGSAAVLNSGITLYPGGTFQMDEYCFDTGAINAIASAATSNLAIQEFTT